jgi:hypothetical protein
MAPERLWNANTHYHPILLKAIPRPAPRVLDVGSGDDLTFLPQQVFEPIPCRRNRRDLEKSRLAAN